MRFGFFFTKTKDNNNCATCNLCGQTYKMGGVTTNLKNHIIHKHSTVLGGMSSLGKKNCKSRNNTILNLFSTSEKSKRQKYATTTSIRSSDGTVTDLDTETEEELYQAESNKLKEIIQVSWVCI